MRFLPFNSFSGVWKKAFRHRLATASHCPSDSAEEDLLRGTPRAKNGRGSAKHEDPVAVDRPGSLRNLACDEIVEGTDGDESWRRTFQDWAGRYRRSILLGSALLCILAISGYLCAKALSRDVQRPSVKLRAERETSIAIVPDPVHCSSGGPSAPGDPGALVFVGAHLPKKRFTLALSIKTSLKSARQTIVAWASVRASCTLGLPCITCFVYLGLTPQGHLVYQERGRDGHKRSLTGSNADLADGKWHSVVVYRASDGGVQLTVDGETIGQGQVDPSVPTGLSNVSPSSGTGEDIFNGTVHHVRIYDQVLDHGQSDMSPWPCNNSILQNVTYAFQGLEPKRAQSALPQNSSASSAGAGDEVRASIITSSTTEVCNAAVHTSWVPERRPWAMGVDQLSACYHWAQTKGVNVGDHGSGVSGVHLSSPTWANRNWCWVAIKEVGCHRIIWGAHGRRPHLNWDEMRKMALQNGSPPGAGATPGGVYQPLLHPETCDNTHFGTTNGSWTENDWQEAREWFNTNVEVFVLNLARDLQRMQQIQQRLRELSIFFTRVEGVDLSQPSALEVAQREGLIPSSFNLAEAQVAASDGANRIGGIKGTVGCAAGHFRAQARALQTEDSEYHSIGPVKFNGSSKPQILIPVKSSNCTMGTFRFRAEVRAEGDGLRWLVRHGDSWNTGVSIGVNDDGRLICLVMGKRLEGGVVPNGGIRTVTAEYNGTLFSCGIDGTKIGEVNVSESIPCQKKASIGSWFSGYMSNIYFVVGPKGHRRKPLALVFEDDAHPSDDFLVRLWQLVREELPCDWDAMSLRSMCSYGTCISRQLLKVQPDVNEPEERCRHGVNYGFQGVVYRLGSLRRFRKRWQEVVFNASRPHCLDVDVALASISDDVGYYAVPYVQFPGLLQEAEATSSRVWINNN